jgi:hypothetical protein
MSRRVTYYNSSYASFQYDVDALEFITNWETNTTVVMQETQRLAVDELYKGLKGLNTVNGTDFLTDAKTRGAIILPMVPLNNSSANALAYELDAVSNGVYKTTFVGWTSGQITADGVLSTVNGRRIESGKNPSNYNRDSVLVGGYARNNVTHNGYDYGCRDSAGATVWGRVRTGSNTEFTAINSATNGDSIESLDSRGLRVHQRISSSLIQLIRNSTISATSSLAVITPSVRELYFYGALGSSSVLNFINRQYCLFYFGLKHLATQEEIDDWYELWQRFQTNIITGGRQV